MQLTGFNLKQALIAISVSLGALVYPAGVKEATFEEALAELQEA